MGVSKAALKCLDEKAGKIFIEDLKTAKIKKSLLDECEKTLKELKVKMLGGDLNS